MFEIPPLSATTKQSADKPKAMRKTDRKLLLITDLSMPFLVGGYKDTRRTLPSVEISDS
jgi:hypothetical protein